ncbi:hypothetical protein [Nostoc sp. NZL]|uniref:hypothetical protein n=1 Tax=Nostoc sp. NZL TaxID=2650612 RepID=UPI0018C6F664|nr:hypothetical protein [Nostoc sp. NZL]MBG1240724.1 hypothetical protein [Nostoc sp. NZL]MBG1240975.1 hypothetical protein [Nostoc sp. NZL]
MKLDVKTYSTIAATNSSSPPGITLTLETTGVFLGILVSASVLAGVAVNVISKMNRISSSISQIEEALKVYAGNAEKIRDLDKKFDLHIQEYINRKDVVQMVLGQLDQKINHKFKRLLFYTRDVQQFLQRDTAFKIREYEETTQQDE